MALCIGQYVSAVVLDNCQRNSIVGRVRLIDGSIRHLDLVGNLPAPLGGGWLSLQNVSAAPIDLYAELPEQIDTLARQQIGAFGGLGYRPEGPVTKEGMHLAGRTRPPRWDSDQGSCIDLEWHSQNGLVRIDHALRIDARGTGDDDRPPVLAASNGDDAPLIIDPDREGEGDALLYDPSLLEEEFDDEDDEWIGDEEALEEAVEQIERFLGCFEEEDEGCFEEEDDGAGEDIDRESVFEVVEWDPDDTQWLMDLASQREEPIAWLLPEPLRLPRAVDVQSEAQAEELVRLVLARLAQLNVSFHVCPHLTGREIYAVLIDRLLPHAKIPPALPRTDVIANYDASAYCPRCRAELDSMGDSEELDDW